MVKVNDKEMVVVVGGGGRWWWSVVVVGGCRDSIDISFWLIELHVITSR